MWLQTKQQPAAARLHHARARTRTRAPEFVLQNMKTRKQAVSSAKRRAGVTRGRTPVIQQLYPRQKLPSEPGAPPNPPVSVGPGTSFFRTAKVSASTRKPAPDAAAGLTQHQRPQDGREEGQAEQEPCVLFHHHRKTQTMTAGPETRSGPESSLIRSSQPNRAVGGAYKHVRIGSGPIVEPGCARGPAPHNL